MGIGLEEARGLEVAVDDADGLANLIEGGVGGEASGGVGSEEIRAWWMTAEKCQRYTQKP
jgi:hypothetical protein